MTTDERTVYTVVGIGTYGTVSNTGLVTPLTIDGSVTIQITFPEYVMAANLHAIITLTVISFGYFDLTIYPYPAYVSSFTDPGKLQRKRHVFFCDMCTKNNNYVWAHMLGYVSCSYKHILSRILVCSLRCTLFY